VWRCEHCGELVDDDQFERCWNCGTPRPGVAPAEEPPAEEPSRRSDLSGETRIAVFQAIGRGARSIVEHPVLVLAGVPFLVWQSIERTLVPEPDAVGSLVRWSLLLTMPVSAIVGALTAGFIYAFIALAARGRPSTSRAAILLLRRAFPLLGAGLTIRAMESPFLLHGIAPYPTMQAFLFAWIYLWIYLSTRLAFWSLAIVVDECRVVEGARRAWDLARGNWWRLAAVQMLPALVHRALVRRLPGPYVDTVAGWLLGLVADAILAMAYLQRVGTLPRIRPTLGDLVAEHAVRVVRLAAGRRRPVEKPIE